jgi:hypothetical protein
MTRLAPHIAVQAALRAVEAHPSNPVLRTALGHAHARSDAPREAAEALEQALAGDPAGFRDWALLAYSHLRIGNAQRAREVCERGMGTAAENAKLHYCHGTALGALGEGELSRAALERCVALGDHDFEGLRQLLRPLARREDGGALLDYCDALPEPLADCTIARACRAIALSRLGRTEEACAMVDLDRHVARIELEPPDGFGSRDEFHAALAAEIAHGGADDRAAGDSYIIYGIDTRRRPVLRALHDRIRAAMAEALAAPGMIGPGGMASALPEQGVFVHGITQLRGDGRNGEHVHPGGLISAVYHVRVPEGIGAAGDRRGALVLGGVGEFANGHQACWGRRDVPPREGWLTIFPSHFFHDVVPTRLRAPRISIPVDLQRP